MAGLNVAAFGDILKLDYKGPIRDQLNNAMVLLKRIQRKTEGLHGKHGYLPLLKGRNEGIGARPDDGTLPTAGNQQYANATFHVKHQYGRIGLTGPTMRAAAKDRTAFTRAVTSETRGMVRDLKRDIQRQLWGDGTGQLAQNQSVVTNNTLFEMSNVAYLRVGMTVSAKLSTGASGASAAEGISAKIVGITKRTTFGGSVELDAAATMDATNFLYRFGNTGGASTFYEMSGLQSVVATQNPDSGVYGGVSRATAGNEFWKANGLSGGGTVRPLKLTHMEESIDELDIIAGNEPTIILARHRIVRRYGALMLADRRFVDKVKLDGGYEGLAYEGIPFIADRDAIYQKIFFVDESALVMFEMSDWEWMDDDGAVLSRVLNKDAYEATLYKDMELGCEACNRHLVLAEISETVS